MAYEPSMKWGLNFMGPIKAPIKITNNQYTIVAIDYTTKFIYENIITKFGCPTHFISDQGSHFINKIIEVLVAKFMIVHHTSTTYYAQGNG
jgi:hypothetical protein